MSGTDERLAALGLALPPPFPPAGTYVNALRTGSLLVLGGHVPWEPPDRSAGARASDRTCTVSVVVPTRAPPPRPPRQPRPDADTLTR